MTGDETPRGGAIERLSAVPWDALRGVGPALESLLTEILAGAAAERVLDRFLRASPRFDRAQRAAVAEALFGVGLWRRRLLAHLGRDHAPPLWLLASLLRDLAGAPDAERLAGLDAGTLPPPRPAPHDLARRFSLPDWLAAALVQEVGEDAVLLADALATPGPICLRANLLRTTRDALAERLAREGVATRPGRHAEACLVVTSPRPNIHGLASEREGLFEVQDEGSQLLGAALEARPGEAVLDLCAGAGGKTLQLAAALRGSGTVHATDLDLSRLERLRHRAARAGAENVRVHGREPPASLEVDRVLVDAPCSELGALRRGPDLRFRIDPASFAPLPALQLALLDRAARHVRPGGRLVYATCTFRREEDEAVARAFEAAHPAFVRVRPAPVARLCTEGGFLRTWPHRDGMDAFFAAAWDRAS